MRETMEGADVFVGTVVGADCWYSEGEGQEKMSSKWRRREDVVFGWEPEDEEEEEEDEWYGE